MRCDDPEPFYKLGEVITSRARPRSVLGDVLQWSECYTRRASGMIVPRAFYKWREVITRRAMPRSILGGVLQRSGCSTRRAGGVIIPRAFYKLREVITSRGRPRRAAGGITTYLVVLQVGRAARSFRGILRAAGGLYKPGDAEEHPRSSSTMRESFYKVGRSAWRLRDVLQACESLVQAGESRGASRDGYYNLLDVLQPRQARRRHMGSVLQGIYKARGQQSSTIVGGIYKH